MQKILKQIKDIENEKLPEDLQEIISKFKKDYDVDLENEAWGDV